MTTADVIARLNQQNDDVVIVRVSGSVRFVRLASDIQGKLTYTDGDEMVKAAISKANEKVQSL